MTVRTHAKPLRLWLRALCTWLSEARVFWLTVAVLVVTVLFIVMKVVTELEIRIDGWSSRFQVSHRAGLVPAALGSGHKLFNFDRK